jgi:hypothetical protein
MWKKLVLLKTFYYRSKTQDGLNNANRTYFIMNPPIALSAKIRYLTYNNFNSIKNQFISYNAARIPSNNNISEITKQTFQENSYDKNKM